jgi:hypothetical protein
MIRQRRIRASFVALQVVHGKGLVVSRGPIPTYSFSDDQSRTYSFSDNVSLILGEAAPQSVPHTVSRIVSTQIIDAALNMAPNNQKTEVVPPAEVREGLPLPSDPKIIFPPAPLAMLASAPTLN